MKRSYYLQFFAIALLAACGALVPAGRASAIYVQYFQWGNGAASQVVKPGESAIIRAHCQDQDGYKIYNYAVYGGYPDPYVWAGGGQDVNRWVTNPEGTYQYWFACQDNQLFGYERAYSGPITLTVTNSTVVSSFTASPASVRSGSRSTLSWDGSKGVKFSSCQLTGGQWGSTGAWFTALPGSIQTEPIAADTTYSFRCLDTDGASTPTRTATVTLRDLCSNIPGTQATAPANSTVIGGEWNEWAERLGLGDRLPNRSMCLCNAGYTLQGDQCIGADACSNIAGIQPSVPANGTVNNGVCSCNAGYSLQGSACVASCSGAHQVGTPPSCSCETGYQMQNGSCVQVACPGANEINWPTCSCAAGYSRDAGTNTCIRQPQLSITVNGQAAVRVHRGTEVTVAWSASGVAAGSCSVRTNAGSTISTSESGTATPAVGAQTAFRLACLNDAGTSVSREANVTLIPEVIEQ